MAKLISTEESLKERLGSDLKFPINTNYEPISGTDLLLQDIEQLLLTIPGERVFRPEWGCTLRNQLWENMEDAEINGKASIRAAIEKFEPRVTLLDVTSESNYNTGLIDFNVTMLVNNTDVSLSLVFPFRTGTELSFA